MVKKLRSKLSLSGSVLSIFMLFSFLLISFSATAAGIQVQADRNPVSLNESFQLIYKSSDSVDGDPDFSPLEPYVEILNQSQSSNVSIINGQYSSSKTWTLAVMSRRTGSLVLPPILFGSDKSDSYRLTVKPASENQQQQSEFYTRIRVDQQQVYAQQQLVITQQLFSDKNLSAYGLGELDFNGMDVITQALGDEKQYKTRIGEKAYLVIERSYAVFPQASGLLKINPVLAEAQIGSAANSFFGSLGRNKVIRARSNELDIAVLPVPSNINVNPWLPAKEFELLEQWAQDPPKFKQGEPVTRTLSIKADGLTAAQLPVLPDISIDGIKQYPDQPMLNDIKNDSGISGYRVEKVALIPTKAGQITLPAIEIPWWNTATQKREVARVPARTIQVIASDVLPATTLPVPQEINKQVDAISTELAKSPDIIQQPVQSRLWMILAIIFAAGWIATALSWFFMGREKRTVNVQDKQQNSPDSNNKYKQLKTACDKKDSIILRQCLVNWARAFYSKEDILNLQDILQKVSGDLADDLADEFKKLDAVLYGDQQLEINYNLIAQKISQLMQDKNSIKNKQSIDLLEPMYK